MSAMSDWLAGQVITHVFRNGSFAKPTSLAVALCTSAVVDQDSGDLSLIEVPNTGAYARQVLNPGDGNWSAVDTNDTTSNIPAIVWPTAQSNWGTITHVAIVDSAVWGQGNLLFWGPLQVPKPVSNGDTFEFQSGQLSIQIDN